MKKRISLYLTAAAFLALVLFSTQAADGARKGLAVCAGSLIPSLLPFFTLSNLLMALGLPDLLAGWAGRPMEILFRVSGSGAQAFILGLSGGYPIGASAVADMRRERFVTRAEAERLLAFCNNSGPAFILGAAGGVFRSPKAGALLFVSHVLAAVSVGILLRGKEHAPEASPGKSAPPLSFREAFPAAVSKALTSTLAVSGYVVLFSALLGCVPQLGGLPPVFRALVTGFFELGSGISVFAGLSPTPEHLAAASFLLGWGGLSVHAQTVGTVAGTDIKCARHLMGRALCGILAAGYAYVGALLLFQ